MSLLNSISSPADLKKLSEAQLPALCDEIRAFLLQTVSRSGGHLASNLGVVELTVALHYVFSSPHDRFCWDVGHQTYVHKILTGRKEGLPTVRTFGGLSGFPKNSESPHDLYETGHAGTAVSQALGEAIARDLKLETKQIKEPYSCVAIVGDASIVTGMSFEAMNHAGFLKTPFLVILNDNEMSISENVGAISYMLNRMIMNRTYNHVSRKWFTWVKHLPLIGKVIERFMHRIGALMKGIAVDHQFFEELGFRYLGPIDGHDVIRLVNIFKQLKHIHQPTILHTVTRKGKGYGLAELNPIKYHGVSPFEPSEGLAEISNGKVALSQVVGSVLSEMAKKDKKIAVITPAMKEGSGLGEFAQKYPSRFFDAGIAEQHATTFSGALAKAGLSPFLCIYSTFLQRGFDQLIHDVCLMNLPLRLVLDRAGCVGGDGETHQGLYDIAFMASLPNIILFSAADGQELVYLLTFMAGYDKGPVSVRFPKKDAPSKLLENYRKKPKLPASFNPFQNETMLKGKHGVLFAEGAMVYNALQAAALLKEKNILLEVVLVRCLKPLDKKGIEKSVQGKKVVITLENHVKQGGMGSLILNELNTLKKIPQTFLTLGYPEVPIEHGSILAVEQKYELDPASIAKTVAKVIKKP